MLVGRSGFVVKASLVEGVFVAGKKRPSIEWLVPHTGIDPSCEQVWRGESELYGLTSCYQTARGPDGARYSQMPITKSTTVHLPAAVVWTSDTTATWPYEAVCTRHGKWTFEANPHQVARLPFGQGGT